MILSLQVSEPMAKEAAPGGQVPPKAMLLAYPPVAAPYVAPGVSTPRGPVLAGGGGRVGGGRLCTGRGCGDMKTFPGGIPKLGRGWGWNGGTGGRKAGGPGLCGLKPPKFPPRWI